jgi:hypothetical protein
MFQCQCKGRKLKPTRGKTLLLQTGDRSLQSRFAARNMFRSRNQQEAHHFEGNMLKRRDYPQVYRRGYRRVLLQELLHTRSLGQQRMEPSVCATCLKRMRFPSALVSSWKTKR